VVFYDNCVKFPKSIYLINPNYMMIFSAFFKCCRFSNILKFFSHKCSWHLWHKREPNTNRIFTRMFYRNRLLEKYEF
jgi:hypothetical protein